MKNSKIYLFSLGIILAFTANTLGQEKNYYRMERLKANNPWITSHNAAGLTTNRSDRFSVVEGSWQYENGKFRNVQDPSSFNRMSLLTESILQLNKVYFYGKFSFDYNIRKNMGWTNVLSTYNTPIYLADSVPGEQTMEVYRIDGGVGYPLGKHFAIGAKIGYETTSNAKHKDARNQNTYMNLNLYPGIMFQTGPLRIGANMIYQKMTELVDVKVIGSGKIHEIFEFEGLWHYKSYIMTDGGGSIERDYQQEIYGGSVQAEIFSKKFSFFNEFSFSQRKQESFPSGFTNEKSGEIKERIYDYNGLLHINGKKYDHYLSLALRTSNCLMYENIQQVEIIDQNEVWVQYGIKNKAYTDVVNADVYYQLFRNRTAYNSSWDARIGARGFSVKRGYRLYPAKFTQELENYEGYLSFNKNFLRHKGMFDCRIDLAYTIGDGKRLETKTEATGEIPDNDQYKRRDDLLTREFEYLTSDRFRGGLNIRYTRFLNKAKGMNLYGDARFIYNRSLNGEFQDKTRTNIQALIGFAF